MWIKISAITEQESLMAHEQLIIYEQRCGNLGLGMYLHRNDKNEFHKVVIGNLQYIQAEYIKILPLRNNPEPIDIAYDSLKMHHSNLRSDYLKLEREKNKKIQECESELTRLRQVLFAQGKEKEELEAKLKIPSKRNALKAYKSETLTNQFFDINGIIFKDIFGNWNYGVLKNKKLYVFGDSKPIHKKDFDQIQFWFHYEDFLRVMDFSNLEEA